MRCKQGAGFCRAAKWVADKQRQTRHFKVACIYQVGMMSESEKVEASFRPLSRELEKNSAGTTGSHLVSPYESRLSQYLPLEMQEYSAERVWDNTARKRDVRGKEICSPLEQPELDRPDREMGEDGEDTDEAGATETADYGLSARKGRKTADRIATRQTDLRTFCKQPFVDDAGDEPVMGGEKIDPFGILPDHLLAEVGCESALMGLSEYHDVVRAPTTSNFFSAGARSCTRGRLACNCLRTEAVGKAVARGFVLEAGIGEAMASS